MSFKSASKFVVRNQVVNPSVLQPMARNTSHEPANGSVTCPDHGRSDDTEMIAEIANCRIEYELRPQFKQVYGWFLSAGLRVLMDVLVLPGIVFQTKRQAPACPAVRRAFALEPGKSRQILLRYAEVSPTRPGLRHKDHSVTGNPTLSRRTPTTRPTCIVKESPGAGIRRSQSLRRNRESVSRTAAMQSAFRPPRKCAFPAPREMEVCGQLPRNCV